MSIWSPCSWNYSKIKNQLPVYNNTQLLNTVKSNICTYSEIVSFNEIINLKEKLINVANNNSFIIIGGSCAENLYSDDKELIETIKTIENISRILSKKINKNIIKIGRMAGQYAKPRSNDFEEKNGTKLPVYRGDIINHIEFSKNARIPDPNLMELAYKRSFKDFKTIKSIDNDFFIAHEVLLLDYEESMIRKNNNEYFLSSTHFPWLGKRTRNINSAHVEFLSGIINPIAIKCDESTNIDDLIDIIKKINPKNEIGKVSLTIRAGVANISNFFSKLIKEIKNSNLNVLWMIDPMHGNTEILNNKKTRNIENILKETNIFFEICKENNIYANGLHLEMTGLNVTECIGLSINESNLNNYYKTLCDPRLNREQSIYLANNIKII